MRRLPLLSIGLALLAVPASAAAEPTSTDQSNAAKECRSERGTTAATREAFRVKYGTNKNGKNAYGKCVSSKAKADKAEADAQDAKKIKQIKNAAKTCKALRSADAAAFATKYGTSRNAFGKCVSSTVKARSNP